METSVIVPDETAVCVRRVVNWYSEGFLTEEELLYLLERSIYPSAPVNATGIRPEESTKGE
jgi:hypothetical protein